MRWELEHQVLQLEEEFKRLLQERQYDQALNAAKRHRDLTREHVGEDHMNFAASLNDLAIAHSKVSRFSEAELVLSQALAIVRRLVGEEHPDFAIMLKNLAEIYQATGDYVKAEHLLHRALNIDQRELGESNRTPGGERYRAVSGGDVSGKSEGAGSLRIAAAQAAVK